MSNHTARISLRYRPGADVLSGQIDLGELGAARTVTESADADSTMAWASTPDDPNDPDGAAAYLASFHLVHVSARLQQGALPLPAGLAPTVRTLIDTALESIADVESPLAKVRARAETSTELTTRFAQTWPVARATTWQTPTRPPTGRRCIQLVVPPGRRRQPTCTGRQPAQKHYIPITCPTSFVNFPRPSRTAKAVPHPVRPLPPAPQSAATYLSPLANNECSTRRSTIWTIRCPGTGFPSRSIDSRRRCNTRRVWNDLHSTSDLRRPDLCCGSTQERSQPLELPSEREPPRDVWFTLDEALELLATLEDARDALIESSHLSVVMPVEAQIRLLSHRLDFDNPQGDP